jgi:hypothetical protein
LFSSDESNSTEEPGSNYFDAPTKARHDICRKAVERYLNGSTVWFPRYLQTLPEEHRPAAKSFTAQLIGSHLIKLWTNVSSRATKIAKMRESVASDTTSKKRKRGEPDEEDVPVCESCFTELVCPCCDLHQMQKVPEFTLESVMS